MTLQEYRNQNPVQKQSAGSVLLTSDEVEFGHCIRIHSELYYVQIKMDWWPRTYILKSNDNTLWTTDEDGNPKARSVFAYNVTSEEWENLNRMENTQEFLYDFHVTEPWLKRQEKQLNRYRIKLGIKTKEEDFVLRCLLSFDWRREVILGEIEKVELVNDSVKIIFDVKAPHRSINDSCSHPFDKENWSLEVNTFYNRASYVYHQIRRYII